MTSERRRVLETERLVLDELMLGDAPFALELTNDPDVLRFIGDKGVRSIEDAERYLRDGPLASYAAHAFGLWRVASKADGTPLGMCGLLKRDALADVDIGYAFLAAQRGRGLALEAAAGVLRHAREALGLVRVIALTAPGNERSEALLAKLGFRYERLERVDPAGPECRLFASDAAG